MNLKEICSNCGFERSFHRGSTYQNRFRYMWIPHDYCPNHEGIMDWTDLSTTFKSSEDNKEKL
jgi:hypothetical protein